MANTTSASKLRAKLYIELLQMNPEMDAATQLIVQDLATRLANAIASWLNNDVIAQGTYKGDSVPVTLEDD